MAGAKTRYQALAVLRDPFLRRARLASSLTIPSLIPPEGHNGMSDLPQPNQGLGARLIVHLASYFTSALLPPGRNLFRLGVTPAVLLKSPNNAAPPDLELKLGQIEKIPHNEIALRDWRSPTTVSLQHLIVGGNVLEQMLPDNRIITHPLDRFVVVRDPAGNLIEFIIEQLLDPASLPDQLKALVPAGSTDAAAGNVRLHLYTWGVLKDGQWDVHQELEDQTVPNSAGVYEAKYLPFFALRWTAVAGESYGRGKVEDHIADLITFDGLSKAMRDGAAMASRNIIMLRPGAAGGVNLRRKVSGANNGDIITGNPEDVNMLQFTNLTGMQIVQVELESLRRELGAAFMLTSAGVRNAERVTAEEVRRVGQELDSVQGGAFSALSGAMLRARVDRLIYQMRNNRQLPEWDDTVIDTTILTGLEALGREAETANVAQALGLLQGYPPEAYQDYVKWPVMLKKGFGGLGLADAVNTEDEANAIRQQRQEQQMMADAVKNAAGPAVQAAAAQ
ncbi:Bacteriophage head to tail connecting protein [Devosia enhydra]|uniref:Bacteriophage head to tail connecting protein n=1 Tax=Devosia enhydra TaxID=665118 RepID=A0A1K2HTV3_9HYPH|nr:portal protein [Devosia enhydra]SFZ81673.1 Bacteriophage head to tail connecting protein [Devosia enhydra]